MAHGDDEQARLRNWPVRRHSNKQWRSPGDARRGTPRSAHWSINIDQASAVRGTRASRTSRVVAPPSIVARIGSGSARGSRSEPESRHNRARSVAARCSNERASWPRAIAMAWRKHACARGRSGCGRSSAIWPSRRCNSASRQRSPLARQRRNLLASPLRRSARRPPSAMPRQVGIRERIRSYARPTGARPASRREPPRYFPPSARAAEPLSLEDRRGEQAPARQPRRLPAEFVITFYQAPISL